MLITHALCGALGELLPLLPALSVVGVVVFGFVQDVNTQCH